MSEAVEYWRAAGDLRKARRAAFGVNCPQCAVKRPKAHPTILLPQQRCRLDGYRDQRPYLTDEQEAAGLAPYGFVRADIEEQTP